MCCPRGKVLVLCSPLGTVCSGLREHKQGEGLRDQYRKEVESGSLAM